MDESLNAMMLALMEQENLIAPIYDMAGRVKGELISRGWTEANAESAVLAYLKGIFLGAARG